MKEKLLKIAVYVTVCFVLGFLLVHMCGCADTSAAFNANDPNAIAASVDSVAVPISQVADTVAPGSGLLVKGGAALVTSALVFFAGKKAHSKMKARRANGAE